MEFLNSNEFLFYLGFMLGFFVLIVIGAAVLLIKSKQLGYVKDHCKVAGRRFFLVEISAGARNDYLKRCTSFNASDGFELMANDLKISSDLIALHLRRWFIPHRFLMWQITHLPSDAIAILFRKCVELSNIPFGIKPVEDEPDVGVEADQAMDDADDDWDYPDDGKKPQPAEVQA